jgi:hypothetical protein
VQEIKYGQNDDEEKDKRVCKKNFSVSQNGKTS